MLSVQPNYCWKCNTANSRTGYSINTLYMQSKESIIIMRILGRKYTYVYEHTSLGFISDRIQQKNSVIKIHSRKGRQDVSVSLMFGGPPKMVFGDPKCRVVSNSLTSLGYEARPDSSSCL